VEQNGEKETGQHTMIQCEQDKCYMFAREMGAENRKTKQRK